MDSNIRRLGNNTFLAISWPLPLVVLNHFPNSPIHLLYSTYIYVHRRPTAYSLFVSRVASRIQSDMGGGGTNLPPLPGLEFTTQLTIHQLHDVANRANRLSWFWKTARVLMVLHYQQINGLKSTSVWIQYHCATTPEDCLGGRNQTQESWHVKLWHNTRAKSDPNPNSLYKLKKL